MKWLKRRLTPRRQAWRPKPHTMNLVAHTAMLANTTKWYFDSACSRHMTWTTHFLIDLVKGSNEVVTFGDGIQGNVLGKRILNVSGIPRLSNVMLVERLKANLISVSQLCDDGLLVRFNEDKCAVYNDQNEKIMKGIRSSDNCYLLTTDTRCFNEQARWLTWGTKDSAIQVSEIYKNSCLWMQ